LEANFINIGPIWKALAVNNDNILDSRFAQLEQHRKRDNQLHWTPTIIIARIIKDEKATWHT
jgi:hypothetical protein